MVVLLQEVNFMAMLAQDSDLGEARRIFASRDEIAVMEHEDLHSVFFMDEIL